MNDLFGQVPVNYQFIYIRNQKDKVAEEKAIMCKQLNEMVKKIPSKVNSRSINYVREWKTNRERALKTLSNKRSTRTDLKVAIESMMRYEEVTA